MSQTKVVRITPTSFVGTTAATRRVLFNPTKIPGAVFGSGGSAIIESIGFIDYDDNIQKDTFLYFFQKGDNDLGSLGGGLTISDSEIAANKLLGIVNIIGPKAAQIGDLLVSSMTWNPDVSIGVSAEFGSSDIYVAAVAEDTSTVSTASGKELVITFAQG